MQSIPKNTFRRGKARIATRSTINIVFNPIQERRLPDNFFKNRYPKVMDSDSELFLQREIPYRVGRRLTSIVTS
jgi:hypothetical protein